MSTASHPAQNRTALSLAVVRQQGLAALRLVGGLLVLVLLGILVSPRARDGTLIFLDQRNLFDILARVSNVGILAIGMTLVILTGGIDLSVGSVLSLGSVLAAMLLLERGGNPAVALAVPALALVAGAVLAGGGSRLVPRGLKGPSRAWTVLLLFLAGMLMAGMWAARTAPQGLPVPLLLLGVMAVGLMIGSLNGILVSYGRLQPFIATLATMIAVWGLAWLVPGETNARRHISTAPGVGHADFNVLGSRVGGVIPVPGLFFIGAAVLAHLALRYTGLGRRIYAIGGNEDAARLSGVPVGETKTLVYGASGLLAALTGVLWAAQYHQGFPDAGQGAELDAIAAVVIGGTSLMGGRGGIPGTFMGVLMFGVLNNILTLLQYTTNWQRLVTGGIIAAAVLLQEGQLRGAAQRGLVRLRGDKRNAG